MRAALTGLSLDVAEPGCGDRLIQAGEGRGPIDAVGRQSSAEELELAVEERLEPRQPSLRGGLLEERLAITEVHLEKPADQVRHGDGIVR